MENQESLSTGFWVLFTILIVWSSIWKGLALWKSARLKHKVWFIVMFIINTSGILEIVYLIIHRNKNKKSEIAE